jgi:transcriptional regulator with XRE-family HTH domain
MNYVRIAAELLRALRGKRSQSAFSHRLGFRSNVLYAWESGRRFPTGAEMFWAAKRAGLDITAGLKRFFRTAPDWLESTDLTTAGGVVILLNELRAGARINDLAARSGKSRFALSRWFKGHTEPRLPDFLQLVEITSLRLLDFLAAITDPAKIPSVAAAWQNLEAGRKVAYEVPWSQAVLRVLELDFFRNAPSHAPGSVAALLGISEEEEARCLKALQDTGQIHREKGKWFIDRILTIDTRRDAEAGKRLKAWWSEVGLDRQKRGVDGQISYNLFTVSDADWTLIQELHANYFQAMRRIIAESASADRVVLANLHLITLVDNQRMRRGAKKAPD